MRRTGGFTLVEVVIALFVLAAVSTFAYKMLIGTQDTYQAQRDLVEAQQNARVAMASLTSDLRQISFRKDVTQPSVVFAGTDSIVFVADLFDTIPGAEIVSLHLTETLDSMTANPGDRIIARTVWDTTGAEVMRGPIAYGVADSGLTFHYFDRDGLAMRPPILQPEHISEVEVAVTSQTAHARRDVGFQDVTVTSIVYPRNLPFTPPQPRPNPPGCGSLTSPNCESLTLSWTLPTQNTDGSELTFNDISHLSVYYGTSSDTMNLDTRLARNVLEWTVKDLVGGQSYYVGVSATSIAGVESHLCLRNGSVGSSAPPLAPGNFAVAGGSGSVGLGWSPVTDDTLGSQITAEVTYSVYRSASSPVIVTSGNLLAASLIDTFYTDVVYDSCATYYYTVTAEACGIEGGGATEQWISLPAQPSCPSMVVAQEGNQAGEIIILWDHPSTRTDGSPLETQDLTGYWIYYSLTPGYYPDSAYSSGVIPAAVISGLEDCSTYYVNVAAFDQCGTRGMLCSGLETAARTAAPCNEFVPQMPTNLAVVPGDQRMDLTWDTNQYDCDLDGYRIYYGSMPGVYDGIDAAEGPSPVFVEASAAHVDSFNAAFTLTDLEPCTEYYLSVTCVDVCEPPLESDFAYEASDITICGSCDIAKACVTEIAEGSSEERVRYQVGNEGESDLIIDDMTVEWNGAARLKEVLVGGSSVWNEDGSSGVDPTGLQASPAELDVDDWGITADEDFGRPKELILVFDGTATGDAIDVSYETDEGICTNTLSPCAVMFSDDFTGPDGSVPAGWTPRKGSTWELDGNVLTTRSNSRITPDAFGFSHGDYTTSARVKVTGTSSHRRGGIYVRYQNTGNYYLLRFYPSSDRLELMRKVNYGSLTRLGRTYQFFIDSGEWYDLTIAAYGNTFRVWFDGQIVDWDGSTGTVITDGSIGTGNICLYGWKLGKAYFDDVVIDPTCGCGGLIP